MKLESSGNDIIANLLVGRPTIHLAPHSRSTTQFPYQCPQSHPGRVALVCGSLQLSGGRELPKYDASVSIQLGVLIESVIRPDLTDLASQMHWGPERAQS